ncbi:type II secretion system protein GspG [Hyalangium rubrum]|uniref:Type II secretion system protein GspG n=1 Tax=Hyalangium rubrum TaxID=3103134 RepID=A0ABU5HCX3_9BACT|nr:type II secretion system protein GspG [Hyalangium sp. s54d21]MDY7231321.1 type II secretion system protein GspG [Hyalangium sp. s54d21]
MSNPPTRSFPIGRVILAVVALCVVVLVAARGLRGPKDPSWSAIHTDFNALKAALEKYRADGGSLPEEGALDFLVPKYLPAIPVDPWGRPYVYSSNGTVVFLASLGQDGLRGGAGADQDHTIHDGHQP